LSEWRSTEAGTGMAWKFLLITARTNGAVLMLGQEWLGNSLSLQHTLQQPFHIYCQLWCDLRH